MLDKLAEKHNLWLRMVIGFGCDEETAKDIIATGIAKTIMAQIQSTIIKNA